MATSPSTLSDLKIDRRGERENPAPWPMLVGVLLVAAAAAAAWWWHSRAKPAEVRTQRLELQSPGGAAPGLRTLLNASGYVVARRQATVSSKVTGKVVEMLADEGMAVTEKQLLARLDDSDTRASLALAEAQQAAAAAAVTETEVRLAEALRERQRMQALVASGVATAAELDRLTAEEAALKARVGQQQQAVAVTAAQVAQVRQVLEDLAIRAPFAGVVTSKNAQIGEMISPMSAGGYTRTGICTLVDMASREIEVDVNESFINRVRPRQAVEAVLDAYPEWKIPASVIAIIPSADRQKATVKVRIAFAALDPRVLPEMGVKVAFQEELPKASAASSAAAPRLQVPRLAVRREGQGDGAVEVVFVVGNGRAERRAIRTEDNGGESLVVVAGLHAGERLVIEGGATLKDGELVREKMP